MSKYTDQIIKKPSKVEQIATNPNNQQKVYVFSDINVRDPFVTSSTEVMLYDTKTIVQGVWRLLTTEEGEIPNFRQYGLNVKRFSQYPLTNDTVNGIYNYVKERVEVFETRAEIVRSDVDVDFEQGVLYMTFYLRMKASGQVVALPTWSVQVSTY
jgi:phage baseplate assembly protein W